MREELLELMDGSRILVVCTDMKECFLLYEQLEKIPELECDVVFSGNYRQYSVKYMFSIDIIEYAR